MNVPLDDPTKLDGYGGERAWIGSGGGLSLYDRETAYDSVTFLFYDSTPDTQG